jgi:hypothetical protein
MKIIKVLICIIFAGSVTAFIWWIKENPDQWEKYKPTRVEVQEKIQEPAEKAAESIVKSFKEHRESEVVNPVAVIPEAESSHIVGPEKIEEQVEQEPEPDLAKIEQSYEKPLTSEQAISILQALRGEKESE